MIDTGRVTPGTRATGGTAILVDGPGIPTWGASDGAGELFDVMRCRVCWSTQNLLSTGRGLRLFLGHVT